MTIDKLIKRYAPNAKKIANHNELYTMQLDVPTRYLALLENILCTIPEQPFSGFFQYSCDLMEQDGLVPTQSNVEIFAKEFFMYEDYGRFWRRAGKFLSAMIYTWHENTKDQSPISLDFSAAKNPPNYVCIKLKDCSIEINGPVGMFCGMGAKNCNISVKGNTGHNLGYKAEECLFSVSGNTGSGLGAYSQECIYSVLGEITSISPYILSSSKVYNLCGNTYMKVFP